MYTILGILCLTWFVNEILNLYKVAVNSFAFEQICSVWHTYTKKKNFLYIVTLLTTN